MRSFPLFTFMGVPLRFTMRSLWSTAVLWLLLTALGRAWLQVSWGAALLFGFFAVFLHWVGEIGHQYGHAWVAHRVGYPMEKLRSWYLLVASRYPEAEPELPPHIHIKRALGGPMVSLIFAILAGVAWLALPVTGLAMGLIQFFALENFIVFFLLAFAPLGFTDGSTLIKWVPRWWQERG